MTYLKRLERELIRDWQRLQEEINPVVRALALKAYYVKFELYRQSRAWNRELVTLV